MLETRVEAPGLAGVTTSGFKARASEPGAPLTHSGTDSPRSALNAKAVNNKHPTRSFSDMLTSSWKVYMFSRALRRTVGELSRAVPWNANKSAASRILRMIIQECDER